MSPPTWRQAPQQLWWLLSLALVAALLLALSQGTLPIPLHTLFAELLPFATATTDPSVSIVLWQIRLPRALLAACIGALLALCGTISQSLFRNPLAAPSLIGINAGASAGASLVIAFGTYFYPHTRSPESAGTHFLNGEMGLAIVGITGVSAGALLGGLSAVAVVYRIATRHGITSIPTLLMAGLAVNAFVGGLTQLLYFFSDDATLRQLSLWHMGSISNATHVHVAVGAGVLVLLFVYFYRHHQHLDALLFGENTATSLGVNTRQLHRRLIVAIALGVGLCVTFAGTIAFVGLMVPHGMRWLVGPTHRRLLLTSALGGAVLLVLADTAARTLFSPHELPVGILTALLGAPFFLTLLARPHHAH